MTNNDIDARAFKLIKAAKSIIDANKVLEPDGRLSLDKSLIDGLADALKGYGIVYISDFGVVTKA